LERFLLFPSSFFEFSAYLVNKKFRKSFQKWHIKLILFRFSYIFIPMKWKHLETENVRTGATLRTLREARGLNADELARELHVSRPYLANIEAGRRSLTPALAKKSCEVLRVRPIVLLNPRFLEKHLETAGNSKNKLPKRGSKND
jgi:DNA-binding XRE family transcriptional regulator